MEKTTLQMVLDKQTEFQTKLGYKPEISDVRDTSDLVHTHGMFVMEEVIEMLREMPHHKPWKDYSHLTLEETEAMIQKVREEWIDVFIFVSNIAVFLDMDEARIRQMYLEKLGLNHERQENPELGYVNK